jgi:hypothetical protein
MRTRQMLVIAALLAAVPALKAQVLYGATGSSAAGSLYTINTATGVATLIGPLKDGSGNVYSLTGMDFQPGTHVLFGSTSNNSTTHPHSIVTINPATGLVTFVGQATTAGPIADITFTPNGNLWGWWEPNQDRLVSINTTSGAATALGNNFLNTFGSAIASNSAGVVYFFGEGDLGEFDTLNLTTGQPTNMGTLSGGIFDGGAIAAAKFSPGGVLYAIDNNDDGTGTNLVTINLGTGAITNVGATVQSLDALAFGPANTPPPTVPVLTPWTLVLLAVLLAGVTVYLLRPAPIRS